MLQAVVRAVAAAAAQDYPSKPIKVIATSSAGGTSDIFMRALGDELQKRLGQPIVIENRPGGAFNIGTRACAEAAPDGYTICIIPGEPLVFNQFLFKTLNFDPAGLEPITQLFLIDQALVVGASLNVKSLAELAALSKAKPRTLSYSTAPRAGEPPARLRASSTRYGERPARARYRVAAPDPRVALLHSAARPRRSSC